MQKEITRNWSSLQNKSVPSPGKFEKWTYATFPRNRRYGQSNKKIPVELNIGLHMGEPGHDEKRGKMER